MKKILVVAIASCLPSIANAQALQWAANQRNSTNTAYVFKPCGSSPSHDAFFYRDHVTDACKWVTIGSGITFNAGILSASVPSGPPGATGATGATGPAGPSSYTYPTAISMAVGTAYRCLELTKPCIVSINITSAASLSLTAGTTNTADILVGSTSAVASGTGSVVGRYTNSLTGTLIVGLGINSAVSSGYTIIVPIGGYFAVRQTAGTVSIVSSFDQSSG